MVGRCDVTAFLALWLSLALVPLLVLMGARLRSVERTVRQVAELAIMTSKQMGDPTHTWESPPAPVPLPPKRRARSFLN